MDISFYFSSENLIQFPAINNTVLSSSDFERSWQIEAKEEK